MLNPVSPAEEDVMSVDLSNQPTETKSERKKGDYTFAAGKYRSTLISMTKGKSKNDEPKIVFEFLVREGEGRGLRFSTHVLERLGWKLERIAAAFGIGKNAEGKLPLSKSKMVNRDALVGYEKGSWNGKDRMEVTTIEELPATGGTSGSGPSVPF